MIVTNPAQNTKGTSQKDSRGPREEAIQASSKQSTSVGEVREISDKLQHFVDFFKQVTLKTSFQNGRKLQQIKIS